MLWRNNLAEGGARIRAEQVGRSVECDAGKGLVDVKNCGLERTRLCCFSTLLMLVSLQ